MKKTIQLLAVILLMGSTVLAQRSVSGTITNVENETLIGASILHKGTSNGTVTDIEGNFQLTIDETSDELVISYTGYATQEITVDSRSVYEIVLDESSQLLDEVVIIGYGTSSKRNLTDNVVKLTSKDVEGIPVANFQSAMSGKAAGVRITPTNGKVDAANNVIENSGRSLTSSFGDAFNNDANSSEDIFTFQVTSQTGTNSLITFYASEGNGGRGGDITVNDSYVALFEEADERSTFFYESPENGGRLTSKYTNQFGNVPILRLAEMYLIRAEANLEAGTNQGQSALDDINIIRNRAGASPLETISKEAILKERQLELALEGFFIYDLKRTQGIIGDIEWDDTRLTFPIPQSEMDTNSAIQQNPGY